MELFLNIDAGELPDEPEELYALAHVANIACGGHVGDDDSMTRALERCARFGAQAGAHPSFEDRKGFGRRALSVPPDTLLEQVREQCYALSQLAIHLGLPLRYVKPHGALYHRAHQDPLVARAVVEGAIAALGPDLRVIGPAGGALEAEARQSGVAFAREEFPDRGHRPDGTLIPRGEPGALVTDPARIREAAAALARRGGVDTLCVHGDSPGAVALARAVRRAIEELQG